MVQKSEVFSAKFVCLFVVCIMIMLIGIKSHGEAQLNGNCENYLRMAGATIREQITAINWDQLATGSGQK